MEFITHSHRYANEVFIEDDNINRLWDESTRSMHFTIKDADKRYALPRVLYDIDNNGVCYVYAIQKSKSEGADKSIERKLYKINKGIESPNVHPSKVYAL